MRYRSLGSLLLLAIIFWIQPPASGDDTQPIRRYFDWVEGNDPKTLIGYMSEDIYQVYVKRGLRVNSPGAPSPGPTVILLDGDHYTTEYVGFGRHGGHRHLRVVRMFKLDLEGYWYETFPDHWGPGRDFTLVWRLRWDLNHGAYRLFGNAGGEVDWIGLGTLSGDHLDFAWSNSEGRQGQCRVIFDRTFRTGVAKGRKLNGPQAGPYESRWKGAR